MKKPIIFFLGIAFLLTSIGYVLDSDVAESSLLIRMLEFLAIFTTLFMLLVGINYVIRILFKRMSLKTK